MTMACYAIGSRLRTVRGDVAVEDLRIGDLLLTKQGDEVVPEPIIWIGNGAQDLKAERNPELFAPIRIRKDAIADGQPSSDLCVSPEHCVFIDGKLVPARLLVNGGSIVQERTADHVHYFHVEFERHRIVIAHDLEAESYLDTGNRWDFHFSTAVDDNVMSRIENASPARWNEDAAAPLATTAAEVEPIFRRLALRSGELGYPARTLPTVSDPDLYLTAGEHTIRPVEQNNRRCVFVVPAGAAPLRLMSRFVIPADLPTFSADNRRLGLMVRSIMVSSADGEYVIAADDPSLTEGWHDAESDGTSTWRWTGGAADLPIKASDKPMTVTIRYSTPPEYVVYAQAARAA
jgi:antigen 43